MIIGSLGLLGVGSLKLAERLHIVGVGRAPLADAALGLGSRFERELALFGRDQSRAGRSLWLPPRRPRPEDLWRGCARAC
jgi:hypothetical protein